MTEAVFQHVRVSGKKFERSSIVLDTMWFETCSFGIATCQNCARIQRFQLIRVIFERKADSPICWKR
jgi:hypothetical protein